MYYQSKKKKKKTYQPPATQGQKILALLQRPQGQKDEIAILNHV
jgi:hypothetical protein